MMKSVEIQAEDLPHLLPWSKRVDVVKDFSGGSQMPRLQARDGMADAWQSSVDDS